MNNSHSILGVDYGQKRIGLALVSLDAKLPSPLKTLPNEDNLPQLLNELIKDKNVERIVLGLPRNLSGQDTEQTKIVRDFGESLVRTTNLPVDFQDEALTSTKAEEELRARGKPYAKEDVDALAATYILEDWLKDNEI
ncbi:MAG TPA: Holliday junction resolvase RuvX [Candidatus Sulfotelmatobacter sp.]|nr:Holliday junction resolvase RuvX [Candidatus Sulfotelmatobacter sp.]